MELSNFPLDTQVCTMEIASCKYAFVRLHSALVEVLLQKGERRQQADQSLVAVAIAGINQTPIQNLLAVSKTTKELVLHWKNESGVDISSEVKMPQYEIFKVIPAKCQETLHIGE